jgi:hypothetical protein
VSAAAAKRLEYVREIALGLPGTEERLSHGAPCFFVGGKAFVYFHDNHHGDERLCVWVAAERGMQAAFVDSDPESYFVPPYVGHRGWLGVCLDRGLSDDEIAGALEDAHAAVAPARFLPAD